MAVALLVPAATQLLRPIDTRPSVWRNANVRALSEWPNSCKTRLRKSILQMRVSAMSRKRSRTHARVISAGAAASIMLAAPAAVAPTNASAVSQSTSALTASDDSPDNAVARRELRQALRAARRTFHLAKADAVRAFRLKTEPARAALREALKSAGNESERRAAWHTFRDATAMDLAEFKSALTQARADFFAAVEAARDQYELNSVSRVAL